MKNYLKIIVMTLSLLLLISINVFAEELPDNVRLEGNADGIIFIPGNEKFLLKEGMVPGDEVSRTMTIENKYKDKYKLYFRAERMTPKEEYDLLTKLQVNIKCGDETIYEGPVSGEDGLLNDIYLGVYKPGDSKKLSAKVTWSGKDSGNEYKNKVGEVNWIFRAERQVPPVSNTPHTGDATILGYVILLCTSVIVFVAIGVNKKRVRRCENEEN